jgi:hypothetical protein
MNLSRPQMGSEPPQYPINSQALTLRQSKQSSNLCSSSSHDEPQRHVSFHTIYHSSVSPRSPDIHLSDYFF